MRRTARRLCPSLALIALMAPLGAGADTGVSAERYDTLRAAPHDLLTFDRLPPKPEPGHILNAPMRMTRSWIGAHLAGQSLQVLDQGKGRFDQITGTPALPLRIRADRPGQNMTVAGHRGFGSNALFPVGPDGAFQPSGRGEGAMTLLLDHDVMALGLKLHTGYATPLATAPPGQITLTFLARDGSVIARLDQTLPRGVIPLAWRSTTPIAALQVETTDPGGIALDDILIPQEARFF